MAGGSALNTTPCGLPGGGERLYMVRRGRALQYLTLAWNSCECGGALPAGVFAGGIAPVRFGVGSAFEVTRSLAALLGGRRDLDEPRREAAERRALRIIGICFLLLAAYVLYEAITTLVVRKPPEHSTVGIVLAALSLIVMPLLVYYKRRVASQLGSGALEAEARQTRVCAYLSAILLVGLGLNAWLGYWWADPVAGVAMVPLIAWEGLEAVRRPTRCVT